MFVKYLSLSLAAVLAVSMTAGSADAGHRKKYRRASPMENYYAGPAFVHGVPGLRLFFGDYALSEEEFDTLYGTGQEFDESYYEPEPAQPPKPRQKKAAKAPAKPAAQKVASAPRTGASAGTTAEPQPAKSAAVTCDKAGSIISGYGFSGVKPETCSGELYAFNAMRDGRNFAIKFDSRSGELTDVKKLN